MAVLCPGCGRGYDVALFPFGRTIVCACGARVGLTRSALRSDLGDDGGPRFVLDAMLGRLARWLRVLGYDTAYHAEASDEALVHLAFRESRVLVTRDRRLPEEWWIEPVVVLRSERPLEQLRELGKHVALDPDRPLFTRCTLCNVPLEPAPEALVRERVPPRVRSERNRFVRCPHCDRVYWEGSHAARMRRTLQTALRAQ